MPLIPITEVQTTDLVQSLSNTVALAAAGGFIPKITGISYTDNDTAANTGGGETLIINGANFNANSRIWLDSSVIVPTLVNSTALSFTSPAKAANMYSLYVVNDDGATAILLPGIVYSNTPLWSTTAGSLGSGYEASQFTASLAGTGDAPVLFAVSAGNSLPLGLTLASNGYISGTLPIVENNTTFTFNVDVVDAEQQESSRQFSITSLKDTVTWVSPSNNSVLMFEIGKANTHTFSSFALTGAQITYSVQSGSLPANVSINGTLLSGTPTGIQSNNVVVIRATAAGSGKFADRTFNVNVISDLIAVQYLIIAGGGGGGASSYGGGGGAGGALTGTTQIVQGSGTRTVTVGSGGLGHNPGVTIGTNGGNSSFGGFVAVGGGYGGSDGVGQFPGANGGSGGGGADRDPSAAPGGKGVVGQGYDGGGGIALWNDQWKGEWPGGGGGAGAPGANGTGGAGGNGGIGVLSTITGTSTYYAGGGAAHGATGGLGGGANGGVGGTGAGSSGTNNTGGGGGGGYNNGGNGGSGTVILRYPIFYANATVTGSPTYSEVGESRIFQFNSNGSITF